MRKKPRLFWYVLPSYLLMVLVILPSIGWIGLDALRDLYFDRTRVSLERQAHLLEEVFQQALLTSGPDVIDRMCKAVGRKTTTRVTVILPSGKVVGDSDEDPGQMDYHNKRPELVEAMAGRVGSVNRYSRTLMQQMMYVAIPLKAGGRVQAVLRTSSPVDALGQVLAETRTRLVLFAIFFIVLAVAAAWLMGKWFRLPIDAVRKGAEAFSNDTGAQRLVPQGPAETAALAETVNRMAARLGGRIDDLSSQRNEYEAVFSSMIEGVIAIDIEERLLGMNPAAVKILKIAPGRLEGKSIVEAVRNSSFQKLVAQGLEGVEPLQGDVVMHMGEEQIINIQCIPLRDSGDRRIGSLVILNDVTQVRRLEKVRKAFVANASHEIKTPLTAIKGFVETLTSGAIHRPEEAGRFLAIISNHVNRLEAILEDLLALARLEQSPGTGGLRFEARRISEIVATALQIVQARADEKSITIEVAEAEDVTAQVDATLMEQALTNLIDNAVKYSPYNSTVSIRSGRLGSGAFISITDQGPGIAKTHHSRLFERFYRVDEARSRKLGGTGLGLAIVKHILSAHGGHVGLESAQGQGSTFTVHLPL